MNVNVTYILFLFFQLGVPVFFTQFLLPPTNNPSPNKSEVCDIVNAILDGADCFVFARKASDGKNAVESLRALTRICKEAEASVHQKRVFSELTDISLPIGNIT